MDCQKIRSLLSQYIDNELSAIEKKLAEKHLTSCFNCLREYEGLKNTIDIIKALPEIAPPDEFRMSLLKKIDGKKAKIFYLYKKPVKWLSLVSLPVAATFLFFILNKEMQFIPEKQVKNLKVVKQERNIFSPHFKKESKISSAKEEIEFLRKKVHKKKLKMTKFKEAENLQEEKTKEQTEIQIASTVNIESADNTSAEAGIVLSHPPSQAPAIIYENKIEENISAERNLLAKEEKEVKEEIISAEKLYNIELETSDIETVYNKIYEMSKLYEAHFYPQNNLVVVKLPYEKVENFIANVKNLEHIKKDFAEDNLVEKSKKSKVAVKSVEVGFDTPKDKSESENITVYIYIKEKREEK